MRRSWNGFLIVLCAGMLLSWIYAWAAFIMPLLDCHPFPLLDGATILALAVIITTLHRGRGWRIISIIGLQTGGFLLAALRMTYVHSEWSHSFWSGEWIASMLAQQRTISEWLLLILILLWTLVLWISGIKIARKPFDRFTMPSQFDLGAAAFLLLFLIQLLMLSKGVFPMPGGNATLYFVPFFVFGLLGMGLTRYEDTVERSYIATYRGIGIVLSFVLFTLLFGGGLVILFLPSLMSAADLGHSLLKAVSKPIISILETVLLFFLVKGCQMETQNSDSSQAQDSGLVPVPESSEGGLLSDIMIWGFAGFLGLLTLIVLGLAIGYLVRWLASRRPQAEDRPGIWALLLQWISLARTRLLSFLAWVTRKGHSHGGVGHLYARLLRWGACCGLPHIPSETPLEYGSRLVRQFPGLSHEIALIIDLFNQDVYGNLDPGPKLFTNARFAWRRLRSPRLWPARLKTWFISPGA